MLVMPRRSEGSIASGRNTLHRAVAMGAAGGGRRSSTSVKLPLLPPQLDWPAPARPPCSSTSCPQAPLMSCPFSCRIVQLTPYSWRRMRWKAAVAPSAGALKLQQGDFKESSDLASPQRQQEGASPAWCLHRLPRPSASMPTHTPACPCTALPRKCAASCACACPGPYPHPAQLHRPPT